MSIAIGVLLMALGLMAVPYVSTLMGAEGTVHDYSSQYIRVRLFGAPAILVSLAAFGVLRGLQDMRTPFWVAVSINILNIILDPLLIFGYGPFPQLGIFGAGLASSISQWIGAVWALVVVLRRLGIPGHIRMEDMTKLFQVGRDLFIRTGLLTAFFIFTTRAATRIGADAGAANQAIRQVWMFTAHFFGCLCGYRPEFDRFFYWTRTAGTSLARGAVGLRMECSHRCPFKRCHVAGAESSGPTVRSTVRGRDLFFSLADGRDYPADQCPGICHRRNSLGNRGFSLFAQRHDLRHRFWRNGYLLAR